MFVSLFLLFIWHAKHFALLRPSANVRWIVALLPGTISGVWVWQKTNKNFGHTSKHFTGSIWEPQTAFKWRSFALSSCAWLLLCLARLQWLKSFKWIFAIWINDARLRHIGWVSSGTTTIVIVIKVQQFLSNFKHPLLCLIYTFLSPALDTFTHCLLLLLFMNFSFAFRKVQSRSESVWFIKRKSKFGVKIPKMALHCLEEKTRKETEWSAHISPSIHIDILS